MPRRSVSYHVAPRYTAGSPAMVDEATARRVAAQEDAAYPGARAGHAGADEQATAMALGLQGIAYATYESGSTMHVEDLLTGDRYLVPLRAWEGKHWYARPDRATYLAPTRA